MITNQNINLATGIPFGYIRADSIHHELFDQLCYSHGKDVHYDAALADHLAQARRQHEASGSEEDFDEDYERDQFAEAYQSDEPIYEGQHEGVKYRTSWLGGAPHLWVFESPVTGRFQQCSPCVPNAANLDCPDPDGIVGYDVPAHWRREDGSDN